MLEVNGLRSRSIATVYLIRLMAYTSIVFQTLGSRRVKMFAISYRIINYTNELPIGADGYIEMGLKLNRISTNYSL